MTTNQTTRKNAQQAEIARLREQVAAAEAELERVRRIAHFHNRRAADLENERDAILDLLKRGAGEDSAEYQQALRLLGAHPESEET